MRAGYWVRFYDPARLPAGLADELRQLMTQSRRGIASAVGLTELPVVGRFLGRQHRTVA